MNKSLLGLIFFIALLFNSSSSVCQDLTGIWVGELIQVPDKSFYFEIRIDKQSPNGDISGTTYIKKGKDFGTMKFTGKVNGNKIKFTESEIIKEYLASSNWYWCIKEGTLNLSQVGDELILEGDWTSPGCDPGSSIVKKKVKEHKDNNDCLSNPNSAEFMRGMWTGDFSQYSCGLTATYQLTIMVDVIKGNKFTGYFIWSGMPNTSDSKSILEGEFKNDSVFLYEPKWISGGALILNGTYKTAVIDCNKLKGIWYLDKLQPSCDDRKALTDGGSYLLHKFDFPKIYFNWSSSVLSKENRNKLANLIDFMKNMPNIKIDISGYTDSTGSPAKNEILSKERADIVMNYLIYKGISKTRLKAKGYSASKPVEDNQTVEGRKLNRRVEFSILDN